MALTQTQIQTAFQNVLQRPASSSELNAYSAASASGALSDSQVYTAIITSPEAASGTYAVTRFYQAAFGRVPDQGGLDQQVDTYNVNGNNLKSIASGFTQATEFTNRYGTDTSVSVAYLQALYVNVLGRTGSSAEIQNWLNAVATPGSGYSSRADVLFGFAQSGEFIADSNAGVVNFLTGAAQGQNVYTGSLQIAGNVGVTQVFTTNVDSLVGGSANDTFNGTVAGGGGAGTPGTGATLTAGDSVNGSTGTDTLNVSDLGTGGTLDFSTIAGLTVSSIEKLVVSSGETVAINTTTGAFANAGITSLTVNSAANAAETITAGLATTVTVNNGTAQAVTVVGGGGIATVTDGAGAITVGNTAAGVANANAYTSAVIKGGTTVAVTDNSGTTGALGTSLSTVSLDGNTGVATLTGKGITNVSISNGVAASDVTITNATANHALNLTVNNDATGLVITDANATSVSVAATGTSSAVAIAAAAATTLNVSGTSGLTLDAAGSNYTALKTVVLTETGSLNANFTSATALTSIDASGSTGANAITLDATASSYTGGSGIDIVTIAATPTKVIDGGAGTGDELVVNIAGPFDASANSSFIKNFEILGLGTAATGTYSAAGFNALAIDNTVTGAVEFTNVKAGAALSITAAPGQNVTYTLADASGTTDTATLNLGKSGTTGTAGLDLSAKTASFAGVETVTINSLGTGTGTNALKVSDVALKSLIITGGEAITVTGTDATALTSINASAATKAVNLSGLTTANAVTEVGGTAADVLKASAGLSTLTGGTGSDTFQFTANANGNTYATVTDFTKTAGSATGDILDLGNLKTNAFVATTIATTDKISLASTAAFADYLNAAAAGGDNAAATFKYFNFSGDTYAVVDNSNATTFQNGTGATGDQVVKLTGVIDLTGATLTTAGILQA